MPKPDEKIKGQGFFLPKKTKAEGCNWIMLNYEENWGEIIIYNNMNIH